MVICSRIEPSAWAQAFPLIKQLRAALDEAEFLQRVRRQSHGGYELVGAYRDGRLIGVMGMRPVTRWRAVRTCMWTIWWSTRPCAAAAPAAR
ncbi:hypothetical protein WJ977_27390 [Achromobacter xylosoxidans]